MTDKDQKLYEKIKEDLKKALGHLEYSYKKAKALLAKNTLDEDDLESLEGYASRFARASDITIQKLLRYKVLQKDPAYRGGVIDTLNEAEKFGWIDSAQDWEGIRVLRNSTAHEYTENELRALFSEILRLTPKVLQIKKILVQ